MLLASCRITDVSEGERKELSYAIVKPGDFPPEIDQILRRKKESAFQMAYESGDDLYILRGYGKQKSGGFSIQIEEVSKSENAVFVRTKLVGSAAKEITFDEDYNVPDARPDVGRMIQKKGEVTIGDVQISEGKARVFGGLTFHLLYVSDGERRRICQLSGELPIDETIHLDGLTGGDKVCITWEVEDLNLHLINSSRCTRGSRNCATLPCRWKSAGRATSR